MYPLPSLRYLAPSQLITILQQFNSENNYAIYPIWLNNQSQPIIGLLPKATFQIQYCHQQYQLIEQQRQSVSFDNNCYKQTLHEDFVLNELTSLLEHYQNQQEPLQLTPTNDNPHDSYQNGLIGFISYDISANYLVYPNHSDTDYLSKKQPLLFLGHYDIYLTYQDNHWYLNATTDETRQQLVKIENWLHQLISHARYMPPTPLRLLPLWKKSDYQHAFEQVQGYLNAGDCYQINLTQCWQGKLSNQQLVDFLPNLHQSTNAPFAGYIGLTHYELLSCSPELFFTFTKNAQGEITIITKPIKGTRPRGLTHEQDVANKNELANSEKDTAENVMIVDLLRNDLGKYAKSGSVKVPKLFEIESFSNVHHMVSTITATLKNDVSPWTVLFESLPAGSITGTPKKRAVEIINELEAKPRGAYCGSMGYLNFDGTGQWNVLIRTLQSANGTVSLWAGGGITIASDCEAEYQECFDKVGNLLNILQK